MSAGAEIGFIDLINTCDFILFRYTTWIVFNFIVKNE